MVWGSVTANYRDLDELSAAKTPHEEWKFYTVIHQVLERYL